MRLRPSRDLETNIGILAGDNDTLWNYRNFLNCFEKETGYKLSITLVKDRITAWRGMTFNQGGYDILILDIHMDRTKDTKFIQSLFQKKSSLIILNVDSSPELEDRIPGVMYIPDLGTMTPILKEMVGALQREYQTDRQLKTSSGKGMLSKT